MARVLGTVACVLLALSAVRAEVAIEQPGRVERLPAAGPHWVVVSDYVLQRQAFVDLDAGRFLGMISTGYSSLDLITNLDAEDDDEDETRSEAVALNTVSGYVTLDPDDYTIKLKRTGSGSILRSFSGEELVEGTINTYVAFGEVGAFGALRLDDTQDEADAGETKLSVANVSSAGALDVYITDTDTELDDTTPVLSGVGAALNSFSTDSGTFRLRVTANGDNADVRLDIPDFSLPDRDGKMHKLSDFRGKKVLVITWASW